MTKTCLYVAVLLVLFIKKSKMETSYVLNPSESLYHEKIELDDSLSENDSNLESRFNEDIHFADGCKCDKGKCVLINGKLTCTCPAEYGVYKYKTDEKCMACMCGKEANCTFDPDWLSNNKKCICPFGFKEKSGKCEVDPCSTNPCKSKGRCTVNGKSFKCNCTKPYYGTLCEKDPCTSKPCQNDGTCVVEKEDYSCSCKLPFSGKNCESGPCSKNPCKNGGTCKVDGTSFKCNCTAPYSGSTCDIDPCTKAPCKNGGTCKVDGKSFKCDCKSPYLGNTCEDEIAATDSEHTITDYFTADLTTKNNECYCGDNSVSCRLDWKGNKLCFCKDGFDQRRGTETCSRTCQSNADCRNDGECDRDGPGYFCFCPEPYTGDRCEVDVCNYKRFECNSMGAECVRDGTAGMCKCPKGKTMAPYDFCEDICTAETCVHGTCKLNDCHSSLYECICHEGYYGIHCEIYSNSLYAPYSGILVILGSAIVLFSIASIIAGRWVKKLREEIEENAKQNLQP